MMDRWMDEDEQMDDGDVKWIDDDYYYFISSMWLPISSHCSEDHSNVDDEDDSDEGYMVNG